MKAPETERMNPKFLHSDIVACTGAKLQGKAPVIKGFHTIFSDSRLLADASQSLFVALQGPRNDGNDYVSTLYEQGFCHFLVRKIPTEKMPKATFYVVKDTLVALQKIAAWHRGRFHYPLVGITGSNGKTIVKEWLYELVKEEFNTVRSPKSYNSQVGVPLSIFNLREDHELAIIEAGISQPGEMQKLETIIKPTVGILTNILDAHGENFKDDKEKLAEKLKLFKHCETLITSSSLAKRFGKPLKTALTWNIEQRQENKNGGVSITLHFQGKPRTLQLPFSDESSVENACHAYCTALYLGVDEKKLADSVLRLQPLALRLETLEGIQDSTILADCYSNDLSSLENALNTLKQRAGKRPRMVILSSIMQGKLAGREMYIQVAKLLNTARLNKIVLVGQEFISYKELFPKAYLYNDTREFLDHFDKTSVAGKVVLVKGAREFGFEKISSRLQAKLHQTVLEINLNALTNNLHRFRAAVSPKTRIMCMVKAMGYGAGGTEVASLLQQNGADYMGVAYTDEGVSLRKAGITLPIMVMNPEKESFETLIEHELEPEIYSLQQLDQFVRACINAEVFNYPIHIKLETGMNRLGFNEHELPQLVQMLAAQPEVLVKSVFSHLAGSDNPSLDQFTEEQFNRFTRMSNYLSDHLPSPFFNHIANTGAIVRFPKLQLDMVRLGIGLYGVKVPGIKGLREVCTFRSVISQIKRVNKNETVGYNRSGKSAAPREIGIVPIGYADGLRRSLSNGKGKLWVNGKFAPIVGNICMDMCMINLTGITAREGDVVEVFGQHQTLENLSKSLDTIPYEVLTSVSSRVKRVYLTE